ncbi:MAG TPA: shikimate kinase [Nitrospira sp.]|jgi:shikimate kinase|nr:shikimate kinase [Nitrospira sp.]
MNIVLIGYRGTGKSTIGKAVAARLGRQMVSTDKEIVRRAGSSIPEIVAAHGWEYFRDLESTICQELAGRDDLIIDTGGGAILRQQNVDVFKRNGRLIWLTASVETIAARIGGDRQRPSLTGTKSHVDEIREVLTERIPKYQAAADVTIATDGQSVEELAANVILHCTSAPPHP